MFNAHILMFMIVGNVRFIFETCFYKKLLDLIAGFISNVWVGVPDYYLEHSSVSSEFLKRANGKSANGSQFKFKSVERKMELLTPSTPMIWSCFIPKLKEDYK